MWQRVSVVCVPDSETLNRFTLTSQFLEILKTISFRLPTHHPCLVCNKLLRCKLFAHSSLVPYSAPFSEQSES